MAPRLVFTPSLASTTKIPLGHACSSSVTFRINVTVYREWFTKFRSEGRRIEVWSDLPGGGRNPGQWGETTFVEQVKTLTDSNNTTNDSTTNDISISLLDQTQHDFDEVPQTARPLDTKKVTLVAAFTIPQTFSHYSYTFRTSGPGNRVEWLGTMGSNGTVIVGEGGHRCGFEEHEGVSWSPSGSSARKWDNTLNDATVEIGKFTNVEMIGWGFGDRGSCEKVTPSQSSSALSLFLLHPKQDAEIASRPYTDVPSSIVVACTGGTATLTQDGRLLTSAKSVSMQEFYPFSLHADLEHATGGQWEPLEGYELEDPGYSVVRSAPIESLICSSSPITLAVLPAVSGATLPVTSTIALPLASVIEMLQSQGQDSPLSAIYSPESDSVLFLDFTSPVMADMQNLALIVGRDGGEVTLAPAYEIGKVETFPGDEWEEPSSPVEDLWTVSVLEPALTSIKVVKGGAFEPISTISQTQEIPAAEVEAPYEDGIVTLHTPVSIFSPLPAETPTSPTSAYNEDVEPLADWERDEIRETPANRAMSLIRHSSQHLTTEVARLSVVAILAFLTYIQVVIGLWGAFLMHGLPQKTETEEPKEMEVMDLPSDEEYVAVDSPTEEDDGDDGKSEVIEARKELVKMSAAKAILTPPMTPPALPPTTLEPLTINEEVVETSSTTKTGLKFSLPPMATRFKLLLAHDGVSSELNGLKLELDGREVDLHRERVKAFGPGQWVIEVDASGKTSGKVRLSVV